MQEPDLLKQIYATMNMSESLAELEIKSAIRMERGIAMPDATTSSPTRPPGARRAGADTGSLQALQCLSRASDLFNQVRLKRFSFSANLCTNLAHLSVFGMWRSLFLSLFSYLIISFLQSP